MAHNLTADWSDSVWSSSTNLDDFFNGALGEFPHIAIIPFNFIVSMVVLGSYVIAATAFMITKSHHGKEGFARSPWWALLVVHIIRGVMLLSQNLTWRYLGIPLGGLGPFDFISNTYFHDLGLYFIVIGQIRALYLALGLEGRGWFTFNRRLWGFFVFVFLTAGAYMSMCNFFEYAGDGIPEIVGELAITSHFVLGGAMTILLLTSGAVLVASIKALKECLLIETYPGYGDWVQLVGIVITFPLILIRITPDLLRAWIYHKPSLPEYIILGIIPEWIIVAIWLSLAHIVPRSYRALHKTEEEAIERAQREWFEIFQSRIDELGDSKQTALENMGAIQACAEIDIKTITLKSFYDRGGIGERFYYLIARLLSLAPYITQWNIDVVGQVLKMEMEAIVLFKRGPEQEDGMKCLINETRVRDLVLQCVMETVGRWFVSLGMIPESTLEAARNIKF